MELPTLPYELDDEMLKQTRGDQQPRVRLYRFPYNAVVIGRGGNQELELDVANLVADGVPLYKRPGGGCAVVLDPGNVVVSLALPLPGIGLIKRAFAAISTWMINGLDACGIHGVEQRGVSDLVLLDRKIGGSCVYRTRGLLYYSTTLLFAPDLHLVNRYLQHPPREPAYRQGRSHDLFMGNLVDFCQIDLGEEFLRNLNYHLDNTLCSLVLLSDK